MDLNAIKSRLTSLNEEAKPKEKREKKDYTLIYWKPKHLQKLTKTTHSKRYSCTMELVNFQLLL